MSSLFTENEHRTEIYYCFFERGSNEQMNGQICRFIPEGSDISNVSKKRLSEITIHFNSYSNRSLEGKTSELLLHRGLEKMGIVV